MGKSKIIDYVTEEVERQGHDVTEWDGIIRTSWMLEAWAFALGWIGPITIEQIVGLGMLVEKGKNLQGIRTEEVFVGERRCPPAGVIIPMLVDWIRHQHELTPLENYREFELIHPFVDGNGRAGKIILNYLMKTLYDPVFPPNDFWGRPIRNP